MFTHLPVRLFDRIADSRSLVVHDDLPADPPAPAMSQIGTGSPDRNGV
jgi:hypothetical protein